MGKRTLAILMFVALLCAMMPFCAYGASTADAIEPIDVSKEGSLTIHYSYGGTTLVGVQTALYHVATVSSDFQYTATADFADYAWLLNGVPTAEAWNQVTSTLEGYVVSAQIEPYRRGMSDATGNITFEQLPLGLYLAIHQPLIQDNVYYEFITSFVAVPSLSAEGLWEYDITTAPKIKAETFPGPDVNDENYRVMKLWQGDGAMERPREVVVDILRNGVVVQTVTLSEENHWQYAWSWPKDGSVWHVAEKSVVEGYLVSTEKRENTFVIVNTVQPKEPPKEEDEPDEEEPNPPSDEEEGDDEEEFVGPDTGDDIFGRMQAILLCIGGMVLVLLSLFTGRRGESR